jgi:hypothetical protein
MAIIIFRVCQLTLLDKSSEILAHFYMITAIQKVLFFTNRLIQL